MRQHLQDQVSDTGSGNEAGGSVAGGNFGFGGGGSFTTEDGRCGFGPGGGFGSGGGGNC